MQEPLTLASDLVMHGTWPETAKSRDFRALSDWNCHLNACYLFASYGRYSTRLRKWHRLQGTQYQRVDSGQVGEEESDDRMTIRPMTSMSCARHTWQAACSSLTSSAGSLLIRTWRLLLDT